MAIEIKASDHPPELRLCCGDAVDFVVEAASSEGTPKVKSFSMLAYTGVPMRPGGWYRQDPIIVDIAGMDIPRQAIPVDMNHDVIVGHTDSVEKTSGQMRLKASGVLSGFDATEQTPTATAAREIARLAANKFPWQSSIDASISKLEFVEAGQSVKVNGQVSNGPVYVARKSELRRISFVANGADGNTNASIAASNLQRMNMELSAWISAQGFDPATISDAQRASLTRMYEAEVKASQNNNTNANNNANNQNQNRNGNGNNRNDSVRANDHNQTTFEQKMAAIEAENARIEYIRCRTAEVAESYIGDSDRVRQLSELCASAIEDKTMDKRAYDLALVRFDRASAPTVFAKKESPITADVICAAICTTHKLPGVEQKFSEKVLTAAHEKFRRGIGLRDLLILAAERNNNYRGSTRDDMALCRAAFRTPEAGYYDRGIKAEGPSSIAVPGILSNVANKFLASGFLYTEQEWRKISRIKAANDFKQMTTYRLTGANKFIKVAPGGELKHGSLSELSYTNQVDTYGILLGMDRRDIRNDDLNAFTSVPQELGRGAGDSLNEVFWTEWLDDSTFFPTDKSYNNYDDGATDSVLSLAGLENADLIFAQQTKPDGTPLGVMPKILLVPRGLRATAMNLMNGAVTASAQSTATVTLENVWKGMFDVVSSVYLSSTAITGYSATAWYLLADPNNVAAMEVAFLDGIETPTVETSEFDFDRLGLSMRAWMDWGCNKQEYRAGVKLKGAA